PAEGVAILNADDPRVLAMSSRTRARVVTFSAAPLGPHQVEIRAADVRLDDLGRPGLTLLTPQAPAPVTMRPHGPQHVPTASATWPSWASTPWPATWRPASSPRRPAWPG